MEVKSKDVQSLGRKQDTYIYTMIDKLTSYLVCVEIKTKIADKSRVVLSKMLDQMEKALGKKVLHHRLVAPQIGQIRRDILEAHSPRHRRLAVDGLL